MTCANCGLRFTETNAFCPNCGQPAPRPEADDAWSGGASGILRRFGRDLTAILVRPTAFFRRMPTEGGLSYPLAFALVTHWLGSAVFYLWTLAFGGAVGRFFEQFSRIARDVVDVDAPGRYSQMTSVPGRWGTWIWGMGSVILDPFQTLIWILFIALFVYVAARIFVTPGRDGAPARITFESAARIVCFSWSPSILAAIPVLGWLASQILIWIIMVIGAREVYRVSRGRALVIGMFPLLLLYAALFVVILSAFVLFFKFIMAFMSVFSA